MDLQKSTLRVFDFLVWGFAVVFALAVVLLSPGTIFALKIAPKLMLGTMVLATGVWVTLRWQLRNVAEGTIRCSLVSVLLGIGILLRVASAYAVHPDHVSDYEAYWTSAVHLVKAHEYVIFDRFDDKVNLLRAYRPPGAAFVNAVAIQVFGETVLAPMMVNLVCFAGALLLIMDVCRRLLPAAITYAVMSLLVFWPSDILMAGLAQSESISMFGTAVLVWLALCMDRTRWHWPVILGLSIGLTCLVRNSNLILIGIFLLLLLRDRLSWRRRVAFGVLLCVSVFAVILPWTLRNLNILGVPVLVATNGGENFYTANNPDGDGNWSHDSAARIRAFLPDEVRMDRTGFEWSKEWIRQNPIKFLKLIGPKLRVLVESDDHGAYWAIERGRNYSGYWLWVAKALCDAWWILLWILCIRCLLAYNQWNTNTEWLLLLTIAIVPESLFLLFLAAERYHVSMVPAVLPLAGYGMFLMTAKARSTIVTAFHN